ncbi:ABC transporter substrate-binding protein [Neptuniibacter halophilus]|uniref:ABC transporter substrate-binding protein n=1 Tax=Neptuniibacter halophilus TaxID=651666 RepID=UPI00257258D2|nr:ABC transporter substrate-binding protein [Neptuniibacter halophilus]
MCVLRADRCRALFASLLLLFAPLLAADTLRIGYVISRTVDDMFYGPVVAFMQQAANDLEVELVVIEANDNHLQVADLVAEQLNGDHPLDAVIAVSVKESGARILKVCEQASVPLFIENSAILDTAVGSPRQYFPWYIGEMLPDDEMAGYVLAKYLIQQSLINHPNHPATLVAISGPFGTSASLEREKGLMRAVEEFPDTELYQVVRANWEREKAQRAFEHLLKRYPDISAVWTASDGMALGVADALEGMDDSQATILVGGVDWSLDGVEGVHQRVIQASAGGHFMEGAWALISVHDYLKGHDFANSEGLKMKTDMSLLSAENYQRYARLIEPATWSRIDFKRFSKVYNPQLKNYDFSLPSVLRSVSEE